MDSITLCVKKNVIGIKHRAMQEYGGVEVQLYACLTSASLGFMAKRKMLPDGARTQIVQPAA